MRNKYGVEYIGFLDDIKALILWLILAIALTAFSFNVKADPTRPDVNVEAAKQMASQFEYTLSMIMKNKNSDYAIINGVMLKEHDFIAGAVVKRILDSKVILEKNGKIIVINLYATQVLE